MCVGIADRWTARLVFRLQKKVAEDNLAENLRRDSASA